MTSEIELLVSWSWVGFIDWFSRHVPSLSFAGGMKSSTRNVSNSSTAMLVLCKMRKRTMMTRVIATTQRIPSRRNRTRPDCEASERRERRSSEVKSRQSNICETISQMQEIFIILLAVYFRSGSIVFINFSLYCRTLVFMHTFLALNCSRSACIRLESLMSLNLPQYASLVLAVNII